MDAAGFLQQLVGALGRQVSAVTGVDEQVLGFCQRAKRNPQVTQVRRNTPLRVALNDVGWD